jgi:outer membrane protein TolC
VANARRIVIDAEAQVRKASLEVSRLLNRPLGTSLARQPVSLGEPALLALDSCALAVFDQPARFQALTSFLMAQAEARAPELAQLDASLAAERRQRTAADRAFWMPAFSLEGGVSNTITRGGAGSTTPDVPAEFSGLFPKQQDLTWQFKLQGSLPLFTGMSRGAQRAQAGIEIDKLTVQRESVRQSVYQRVRAALLSAASTYAAIGLTRDAALAAERNYALVTDAYASGSANITTLLDAQTQALNSAEAAANAVHDFLLDLLGVERAIGRFGALESKAEQENFQRRLEAALRSGDSQP